MSDSRDEFEKWYASKHDGFCPNFYDGEYDWGDAQMCWESWQAARAQSPAPVALDDEMTDGFKAAWQNGIPINSAEAKWAFCGWRAALEKGQSDQ